MTDIQGEVFHDFEPPATTDGSYLGQKKHTDATKKHLEMKFEQELAQVNQRLKSGNTKVTIESRKGTIQLRATLPLKPDDSHPQGKDKKQYTISLGIPANFDGLKTAEEEAYELGKLIARQTFTWTDKYLGVQAKKNEGITFDEFFEQFEKFYFKTRKRTLKSEGTFLNYQRRAKTVFRGKEIISERTVKEKINRVEYEASKRIVVTVGKIILNCLDIKSDMSGLIPKHEPRMRDIPDDDKIIKNYQKFQQHFLQNVKGQKKYENNWKLYQLIYGLLATYGLRPREVVNNPNLEWFLDKNNIKNTFKVHKSNKTGYREVLPFVPEWIELFELKEPQSLKMLEEYSFKDGLASQLAAKTNNIAGTFKRSGIEFVPYDLRHACAIRAHLQGLPIKAAADNLGHSIDEHTKTYQRWFGLENRYKAFNQAFENLSELDKFKDENAQLKKRITELETELARYRLNQMM